MDLGLSAVLVRAIRQVYLAPEALPTAHLHLAR
jgi:hypothetical protein